MNAILSLFTAIAIGFVGYIGVIILALSGVNPLYIYLAIALVIISIIYFILKIYGIRNRIFSKWGLITILIGSVLYVIVVESFQMYERNLEVVSTQDVDLNEYRPFVDGTKAVKLNEEPTFKLNDHLPRLDGATALYPVYSAFAQAVYPEKDYQLKDSEVVSNQTSGAFLNLLNNRADIIFMAHPSEDQLQLAENRGIKLNMTPIGREAFVFFVNASNPVQDLSVEQIQDIYSGKIKNWKDVGGEDDSIRAYQRPEDSGSQTALISFMKGKPLVNPPRDEIADGMGGIIEEVSNYKNHKNAIGFSFRFFSQEMVKNKKIKHIAVNGVEPTKENIQNGTYPITAEFYAITREGESHPHVNEFIEWMLSEQGQQIVEKTGYVPIK